MKKILCLTDFSDNSRAGILFANELAQRQGATLIFMHTFKTIHDSPQGIHPALYEYSDTKSRDLLYNMCIDFKRKDRYSKINYEYLVKEGTIADNLNTAIHELNIDLVVLSVEGQLKKEHAYYNSILKHIVQEAECPVLVVPTQCTFSEIHDLVYALEMNENSILNPDILRFADDFKANVRLVTFLSDTSTSASESLLSQFQRLKQESGYASLTFEIKKDDNLQEALNQFCANQSAQIIVMENHSRSEFYKVIHPSFSGQFVYHSRYPVLICNKVNART